MSENGTTRRRAAESAPTTPLIVTETATPAETAQPTIPKRPEKPRRAPAPIDPETRAMRRIESVLADLAVADPTAPARVLDVSLTPRKG
jgi:hypothetical protein